MQDRQTNRYRYKFRYLQYKVRYIQYKLSIYSKIQIQLQINTDLDTETKERYRRLDGHILQGRTNTKR